MTGETSPAGAEAARCIGVRVDGQPALEFVLDVRGRTGSWRVRDVLAHGREALVQFADLLFQFEATGALSIAAWRRFWHTLAGEVCHRNE